MLAAVLFSMTSCSNKNAEETNSSDIIIESEIIESETDTQGIPVETLSDTTESTIEEASSSEYKMTAGDSFRLYMEFVDTFNRARLLEENENGYYYSFQLASSDSGLDFPYFLSIKEVTEEEPTNLLLGIVDGEVVVISESFSYCVAFDYDDFKKLPTYINATQAAELYVTDLVEEIPDGDYFGELLAFSPDGKKALVEIAEPIVISKEEYDSLSAGDRFESLYDSPWYSEEFFDCTIGEDRSIMTNIIFIENSDGNYTLGFNDGDYVQSNVRYAVIDISPDLMIYDPTNWENSDYDENGHYVTQLPFDDGDSNFTNTFLFRELLDGGKDDLYMDPFFMDDSWVIVEIDIPMMSIKDNQLTYIYFG